MNDETRRIVEMAYDGSASTAFIYEVAAAIREIDAVAGAGLGLQLLERLTETPLPSGLNETEAARLRTMRKLLVSAVATLGHSEFFGDETIQ